MSAKFIKIYTTETENYLVNVDHITNFYSPVLGKTRTIITLSCGTVITTEKSSEDLQRLINNSPLI